MGAGRTDKKKISKLGLPPGTVAFSGEGQPVKITIIDYDEQIFREKTINRVEESFEFRDLPHHGFVQLRQP